MPTTNHPFADDFEFRLEFQDDLGHPIFGERVARSDFRRAVFATLFDALRHGVFQAYAPTLEGSRIEPVFAVGQPDSPWVNGFQVEVNSGSDSVHRCEFGVGYFWSHAHRVRAELVRTGCWDENQDLRYRLSAYYDNASSPKSTLPIVLESVSHPVQLQPGSRLDYEPSERWDEPDDGDLPVLIDRAILEEVVAEARAASEREVGGMLLGHLVCDAPGKDVFVAVTGLAAGGSTTEACGSAVTFTPDTFAQTHEIIQLRGAEERIVGWYHSHPFRFCSECPLPTPPECIDKVLFFSQDDVHLMETTFDQPFMVGLLSAVEPRIDSAIGHLPVRLFGWRQGIVQQRGFHVIDMLA